MAPGVSLTKIVRTGGPWRVNVLAIDRRALRGRLGAVLSNGSAAAARAGQRHGPPHARARRGEWRLLRGGRRPRWRAGRGRQAVQRARGGRSALLLPSAAQSGAGGRAALRRLRGHGARRRLLDGVDRRPGRIPAAAGAAATGPRSRPTRPSPAPTPASSCCSRPRYGARTPRGGVEAVVRGGRGDRLPPVRRHARSRAAATCSEAAATPRATCATRPGRARARA